ncbi:3-methylmercaptopropionyl-CoA ligase [Cupriavidus yeoncheonensis]|uniref:3-methylmercaptopropionyl-CoA ligase n=1 Tax=Cupriavidus yeoncheonensis TaxID=1462994 RepID=A0A916IWT9_9BURK|nr:3-(methylthio)propionyl-CoA ligase [Cupriavidus yeoncheonensis]CAG2150601.1 3-methylmercaptopropionyl-CoA ligase [Cupriavidus yeoncheonensis]
MFGLMMDRPLLLSSLVEHAEQQFPDVEIVSRETHGPLFRYTYRELAARSRRLAKALAALGVARGTRVATVAWNNHRHLEAYFAVSGSGAVLHTCNPRLHPEQLAYILNHAEDQVVLLDSTFLPLAEAVAPLCPGVTAWVLMTDAGQMPLQSKLANLLCYETLLDGQDDVFAWPEFDERTASSLCFTSGTTGNPKGVLYSHRSTMLHSFALSLPDTLSLSARDCVLPVVPMFHVNAWGIPYAAPMNGCKLVLPGPKLDGASLFELMESEGVTCSAGVPTIWLGLAQYMEAEGVKPATMHRSVVGGSAMPQSLIRDFDQKFGVEVRHCWGMTETSPLGTQGAPLGKHAALPVDQQYALRSKQGRAVFGVQLKVVDANGQDLPRDGQSAGELLVRGPWIMSEYFKGEKPALQGGWFPTGDIATIDTDGIMQITDRVKDVIKSGGEWISSIDLENAAMGHPALAMAAVIGVKHPKWDERPVLCAVKKPGQEVDKAAVLDFLGNKVARWWLPDEVIFVDSLPMGATGKVQKMDLRRKYADVLMSK